MYQVRNKYIKQFLRKGYQCFFWLLNFCGGIMFFILRLVKLMPSPPSFHKDDVKKILIVRTDMIGDVVLATPLIKATRENFPQAYIAVVVSGLTRDIVMKNPYLDEVIAVKGIGFKNLIGDLAVVRSIKRENFDLALVLFPALSCNFFVFLTGIPHRLGYGDRGARFLLTKSLNLTGFQEATEHMLDLNLDLLRAIGCRADSREEYVSVYEDSEEKAAAFYQANNLNADDIVVIFHPGSRKVYERWPFAKFARLADKLIDELKVKIIFLSGPVDGKLVEDTMKLMRNSAVVASGFSLKDIISVIKKSSLFIGHSTGTTHIADALGVPVIMIVSFFRSGDSPVVWGPSGLKSIVVSKDLSCIPCIPGDCKRGDYPCMTDIAVEEIFDAAKKQLDKIKK